MTPLTMLYDFEKRLRSHDQTSSIATYLYDPDNLKQIENVNGAVTTNLWDGSDCAQGRA